MFDSVQRNMQEQRSKMAKSMMRINKVQQKTWKQILHRVSNNSKQSKHLFLVFKVFKVA